jgi:2-phospho-L-lactate transferase/gluconeogenesis factor (CofD/UPF0052 family)
VRASKGLKVFVCNIVTQEGETQSYSVYDHIHALEEHLGEDLFDAVLCNDNFKPALPDGSDQWVQANDTHWSDARLYPADLVDYENPWRHDPDRLARVLMNLYYERTGPLEESPPAGL